MITITIPLEEYFELRLRGSCSYIVLDTAADRQAIASLTAQPDWQTVAHLEEIHHDVDSGGVFPVSPECRQGVDSSTPQNQVSVETTKPEPVINQRNLVKLWPLKEYKASSENLFRAREESAKRVKAHNDFQRKCVIGKNKMIASGKVPLEKIDEIFKDLDKFPVVKAAIERITLVVNEESTQL